MICNHCSMNIPFSASKCPHCHSPTVGSQAIHLCGFMGFFAGLGLAFLFNLGFMWGTAITLFGAVAGIAAGFRVAAVSEAPKSTLEKGEKND